MSSTSAEARDNNQQVQVGGDNHAPVTAAGTIAVGGNVSGRITIHSGADKQDVAPIASITKMTRIPVSATTIGVISGIISIIGFITGSKSLKEFIEVIMSTTPTGGRHLFITFIMGAGGIALISLSPFILKLGINCCLFLRKNILYLPKYQLFPVFAGIKNEKGRTFPYLLELSLKCPKCDDRDLHFKQVKKGVEWYPMAVCPRHEPHSIPMDVSKNNFDKPLPRQFRHDGLDQRSWHLLSEQTQHSIELGAALLRPTHTVDAPPRS